MSRHRLQRGEVEGFLAGLDQRVRERATASGGDSAFSEPLNRARAEIARGNLESAERILVEVDRSLDDLTSEMELREFPRGLVSYDAKGDRGDPVPDEEQPLANRIRLVSRLVSVVESRGGDAGPLRARLQEARRYLTSGDAARARSIVDAVHAELEDQVEPRREPSVEGGSADPRRRVNEPAARRRRP